MDITLKHSNSTGVDIYQQKLNTHKIMLMTKGRGFDLLVMAIPSLSGGGSGPIFSKLITTPL